MLQTGSGQPGSAERSAGRNAARGFEKKKKKKHTLVYEMGPAIAYS